MNRPRIAFCYQYGLLGGVSAQLLNRFPYFAQAFDVSIIYEYDHGMVSRFPAGVARVAPTVNNMAEALAEIQPDVTVVIDSPKFFDAWRLSGSGGKLVLEVHTTTANVVYLERHEQLADVSHIVTVSSYMQSLLRGFGLASLAPITVVPNCLDDRWSANTSGTHLDGTPVLWVGKLDGHKRWRSVVEIMDDLAAEHGIGILPVMVGGLTANSGEVRALTARLASSPGLARAAWLPWVEYDRMPALYTSVAVSRGVHLSTTSNESFGMTVAESLVRGCPVVAPAVGALPELLPESALYKFGDWAEARHKARLAIVDDEFRGSLLATADTVRDLTRPERVLDAYQGVVSAVLSSSHRKASVPLAGPAVSSADASVTSGGI